LVPKLTLLLAVLLKVTNFTELVVPTVWLPKEREEGEKLTLAKLAIASAVISMSSARTRFMGSPATHNTVLVALLTSGESPASS
jgi:hypothetical protein